MTRDHSGTLNRLNSQIKKKKKNISLLALYEKALRDQRTKGKDIYGMNKYTLMNKRYGLNFINSKAVKRSPSKNSSSKSRSPVRGVHSSLSFLS